MKINGRVRLQDLRQISQDEFGTATGICERIKELQESRITYIEEHGLDANIMLPMANWSEGPHTSIHELYQLVVKPTYDLINNLRLYTQPFTGYQMVALTPTSKQSLPAQLPEDIDEIILQVNTRPHTYVNRYLQIIHHLPKELIVTPPKMLGEIGWNIEGNAVDFDTYTYQERINCLYESGIIDWLRQKVQAEGSVNVLEIGAGYGGLAYHLKRIIPEINYLICDLPESLLFSSIYLAMTLSEFDHVIYDGADQSIFLRRNHGFTFVPNYMFGDMLGSGVRIDLAINTLSFQEMTDNQVAFYAEGLRPLLGETGVLFEQAQKVATQSELHCDVKSVISQYFHHKQTVRPTTVPVTTRGTPDIWGNRPISELIAPSFRRFTNPKWRLYWVFLFIRAFQYKGYARQLLLKTLGEGLYGWLRHRSVWLASRQ